MVQDVILKLPRLSRQGKNRDGFFVLGKPFVGFSGQVSDGVFAVVFHIFCLFVFLPTDRA
jgi:hypothetical protein